MVIKTKGLVIKEQNINEKDKLITILTQNQGIINAFVKNANSFKNKNLTSTGTMCYCDFIIYKGKDSYIIDEANMIESFLKLRKDIINLSLAQYFCELAISASCGSAQTKDILRLLLNCIYMLSNKKKDPDIIKSIVEIKLACFAGFAPNLVCCSVCNEYQSDPMYFDIKNSQIYCNKCYKKINNAIKLTPGALAAFRHIVFSKIDKLFNFEINEKSKQTLALVSQSYVLYIFEKNFKTLDFYNSIKGLNNDKK